MLWEKFIFKLFNIFAIFEEWRMQPGLDISIDSLKFYHVTLWEKPEF